MLVYKYRKIDEFSQRLLSAREAYFCPLSLLNDPNEFHFPLSQEMRQRFTLARVQARFKWSYLKALVEYQVRREELEALAMGMFAELRDETKDEMGVFCCSGKWNCQPMWTHYANESTGFCAGIEMDRHARWHSPRVFVYPPDDAVYSQVDYSTDAVDVITSDGQVDNKVMARCLSRKETTWAHEDEYRLSIRLNKPTIGETRLLPENSIVEVMLGLKMPEKDRALITALARAAGAKVYAIENSWSETPISRKIIK